MSDYGVLGKPLDHEPGDRVEVRLDDDGTVHEAEVVSAWWENYGTRERYTVEITWGDRAGERHEVGPLEIV